MGVLVTAGDKGCSYAFRKNGGSMPAFEIPVVDTTGAGTRSYYSVCCRWLASVINVKLVLSDLISHLGWNVLEAALDVLRP